VSKSVRLPLSVVEFIEKQPGGNFSQKLLGILSDYRSGDAERREQLDLYYVKLRRCREVYSRLSEDYAAAHRIMGGMMCYLHSLSELSEQLLPEIRADTAPESAAQAPEPPAPP
ncbi:MAG: hypothetical protein NC399_11330, partial [Muribaculum sp.]|nr:hypothetical protein [Muribaculum sp.]